jgi:hypothetical protein
MMTGKTVIACKPCPVNSMALPLTNAPTLNCRRRSALRLESRPLALVDLQAIRGHY